MPAVALKIKTSKRTYSIAEIMAITGSSYSTAQLRASRFVDGKITETALLEPVQINILSAVTKKYGRVDVVFLCKLLGVRAETARIRIGRFNRDEDTELDLLRPKGAWAGRGDYSDYAPEGKKTCSQSKLWVEEVKPVKRISNDEYERALRKAWGLGEKVDGEYGRESCTWVYNGKGWWKWQKRNEFLRLRAWSLRLQSLHRSTGLSTALLTRNLCRMRMTATTSSLWQSLSGRLLLL